MKIGDGVYRKKLMRVKNQWCWSSCEKDKINQVTTQQFPRNESWEIKDRLPIEFKIVDVVQRLTFQDWLSQEAKLYNR